MTIILYALGGFLVGLLADEFLRWYGKWRR